MITTISISILCFVLGLYVRPFLSTEKSKIKSELVRFLEQAKTIAESDKTALRNEMDKFLR